MLYCSGGSEQEGESCRKVSGRRNSKDDCDTWIWCRC